MPHTFEAVADGALWYWNITGALDTGIERDLLLTTLAMFYATWRVGGKRSKSHGRLRPLHCHAQTLPLLSPKAEALDVSAVGNTVINSFRDYMRCRAERLTEILKRVDA
jgi:hypothetical protein